MKKGKTMKYVLACIVFLSGIALLTLGVLPSLGSMPVLHSKLLLETAADNAQHDFVAVDYFTFNDAPFTEITCSISTSQLVNPQGECGASDWIAILAYDNNLAQEFIQIGVDMHTVPGTTQQRSPLAFWATDGPVQSTYCVPQTIASLAAGWVHAYGLSFDGAGWSLRFDGSQIGYISLPNKAFEIQVVHETQAYAPYDPGMVNSGVTIFRNIYFKAADVAYAFLTDFPNLPPPYFASSFSFEISGILESNGLQFLSTDSLRMGWGLPTTGFTGYNLNWGTFNSSRPSPWNFFTFSGVGMIATSLIVAVIPTKKHH